MTAGINEIRQYMRRMDAALREVEARYTSIKESHDVLYKEYHGLVARNQQLKEEVDKLRRELNEVRGERIR